MRRALIARVLWPAVTSLVVLGCEGKLECPGAQGGFCPAVRDTGEASGRDGARPLDAADADVGPADVRPPRPDVVRVRDIASPPDVGTGCADPPIERRSFDPSGGQGGEPGTSEQTLEVEGTSGNLLVHVPQCYDGSRPFGLLLAFHDNNGDRDYLRVKLAEVARDREFIVAMPRARPTFGNAFNWMDNTQLNITFVRAVVADMEARYQIDRNDTVVTGLGVGSTFAVDLVLDGEPEGSPFEYVFLVNTGVYDTKLEQRTHVFLLEGRQESPLGRRDRTDRFRFEFHAELGPWFPGPPFPPRPDDPAFVGVRVEDAVDWFQEVRTDLPMP